MSRNFLNILIYGLIILISVYGYPLPKSSRESPEGHQRLSLGRLSEESQVESCNSLLQQEKAYFFEKQLSTILYCHDIQQVKLMSA